MFSTPSREYVRNVLGFEKADHTESNPAAEMPVILQLSCSLVEKTGTIKLKDNSRIRDIYGDGEIAEQYHCNFGFNREYEFLFDASALIITGADAETGEPRIAEHAAHPFFVATLFQPARSALSGNNHSLISAFAKAATPLQ